MAHAISVVNVCLLGAGLYLTTWLLRSRRSSALPPGPAGWPVIGNLFQISSEKNWEDFAALGRKYGSHFPSPYKSFLQTLPTYCRGYLIDKHAGDTLCRSQLVQGHLCGTRETQHEMLE